MLKKKENEIKEKNIEIGRFKKIVNDLNKLKNIEDKLKDQSNSSMTSNKDIKSDNNNNIDYILLKEINDYKKQIDNLGKENELLNIKIKELELKDNQISNEAEVIQKLKKKMESLQNEKLQEIMNNKKLNEKIKKLESDLSKANEELDVYEIESKEADIEIESLKMKIGELIREIKKLRHKDTIQEIIEENDEDDETNNNKNNAKGYNDKNEIFCNKLFLYIKRFILKYKYHLFMRFKIQRELGILLQKYEDLMKYYNKKDKKDKNEEEDNTNVNTDK